jgi:hypothetical protein
MHQKRLAVKVKKLAEVTGTQKDRTAHNATEDRDERLWHHQAYRRSEQFPSVRALLLKGALLLLFTFLAPACQNFEALPSARRTTINRCDTTCIQGRFATRHEQSACLVQEEGELPVADAFFATTSDTAVPIA